jgi:hypothetical protein
MGELKDVRIVRITNKYMDTKEIQKYELEVNSYEDFSKSLIIRNEDDYKTALSQGKEIKNRLEIITSRKEEITKPLNQALKSARELFKPIEEIGAHSLLVIKTKMLDFQKEQTKKAELAKQKLAERVERGTMTAETAVRKIGEIQEPNKTVKTEDGKATVKMVTKYRVTDKSKIPLIFLEPDMAAIKKSFRDGQIVAGVEVYQEEELSLG